MKKALITIGFLLLTGCLLQAQDSSPVTTHIDGDTLFLANGLSFEKGQDIKLGVGSNMADRSFNYIYTSPVNVLSPPYKLASSWANLKMVVKDFKRTSTKRTGEKYFIVMGGGNIVPYWCEIEPALDAKEVMVKGFNDGTTNSGGKGQSSGSVADELIKLKKLYDQGVLTKEEFDAQKKKLLSQ